MSLYEVEFTETLQKTIEVEAEDEYEAYLIAKRMYRKAEVILMAEDYIDTEIDVRLKSLGWNPDFFNNKRIIKNKEFFKKVYIYLSK